MSTALRRTMPALLIGTTVALFAWAQDADEKHKGHGQEKAGEHQKGDGHDKADEHAGHNHAAPAGPAVGKQAEDFTTKTIGGKEIQLHESFKGKLVLLDFWATWCPGGLGVHIIREVMDEVTWERREPKGMRLTMIKRIQTGSNSESKNE